jgi:hypothetical protein
MKRQTPETPLISQFLVGCILIGLNVSFLGGSLFLANQFLPNMLQSKTEADGSYQTPSYREAKGQVITFIYVGLGAIILIVIPAGFLCFCVFGAFRTAINIVSAELTYGQLKKICKNYVETNYFDSNDLKNLADICQLTGRYKEAESL